MRNSCVSVACLVGMRFIIAMRSGRMSCAAARCCGITKIFSCASRSPAGNPSGILIGICFLLRFTDVAHRKYSRARFANGFCRALDCKGVWTDRFFDLRKIKNRRPAPASRSFAESPVAAVGARSNLFWKVARYKDESSQQAGARYLLDRGDSGSFIHFALNAHCRRIRLLRVLSHSHGAPALGVNFERARGKHTESPRANLAPGIREQRIVLVSRCEHAVCRLSLGCFDPSYQRSRAISSIRTIFFVEHTRNLPRQTMFALQHVSPKFAIVFHSPDVEALTPGGMWGMMHAY